MADNVVDSKGQNCTPYGTNDQLISDFVLTRNLEGDKWEEGSISYTQKGSRSEVLSGIPKLGTVSRYFPEGSVLQSYSIESQPGTAWKVTLKYYPPAEDETSLTVGGRAKDFSLSVTQETRCILLYPEYASIGDPAKSYLYKLCQGGSPTDLVYPPKSGDLSSADSSSSDSGDSSDSDSSSSSSSYSGVDTSAEKIPISEAISQCNDATATRAYAKIVSGMTSYSVEHVTWSETEYTTFRPSSSELAKVGKIATPHQAPSFSGRNWRLTDCQSSVSKNEEYWKTVWTYTLSDADSTWDPEIYK